MVSYVTNQDAPTHSLFRVQSSTTIGKQPKLYSLPSHMSSHYICLSWPRLLHSKCRFSQSFAVEKPECFPRAWSMDPSAVWPLDCYSSRCCQAWSLASGAMYNRVPPMKFANLNGWDFHLEFNFHPWFIVIHWGGSGAADETLCNSYYNPTGVSSSTSWVKGARVVWKRLILAQRYWPAFFLCVHEYLKTFLHSWYATMLLLGWKTSNSCNKLCCCFKF